MKLQRIGIHGWKEHGKVYILETTTEGTKTNIYGDNMLATTGADTLYYQYNNHRDVVRVLDQLGTLKNEYDYDAFRDAIHGATKWVPKGEGEIFGINTLRAKPVDGYHDVIIHGSVNADLSTRNKFSVFHNGSHVEIDHCSLAKYIKKDTNYNGGPIRLLSCATGADAKGIAQDLANKLGVEVMAPSDILWAFPNGRLTIGKN